MLLLFPSQLMILLKLTIYNTYTCLAHPKQQATRIRAQPPGLLKTYSLPQVLQDLLQERIIQ